MVQQRGGPGCSHLHIKAKVLLLFKEEIQDKLPHKVRVQRVIDHFCPTKLKREGERERENCNQAVLHAATEVEIFCQKNSPKTLVTILIATYDMALYYNVLYIL